MQAEESSEHTVSVEDVAAIPDELIQRRQWVAWRYEDVGRGDKLAKVPYTPGAGTRASVKEPWSWRTFEEARADALGAIGFMFSADDPYCGVDLDGCRNPMTGEVAPWAQDIIEQLATYTEVSPSGTGVKLWLRATKPAGLNKRTLGEGTAVEVYDRDRYFTVTGRHVPGTPTTIEARQAALDMWYTEAFPTREADTASSSAYEGAPSTSALIDLDDDALIGQMLHSANGAKVRQLWEGDTTAYHDDESAADLALCRHLAFWTGKDAVRMDRLFRHSGLYREKWERADYRRRTIQRAIETQVEVYVPGTGKRDDRRVRIPYPWQRQSETPMQRQGMRLRLSAKLGDAVRQHLDAGDRTLLVVTAPPGSGKSRQVAALGFTRDIAFIAERHNQVENVEALPYYVHILPPGPDNCPHFRDHAILAAKGYNTLWWHREHGCGYSQQFDQVGRSTLYMVEHVPTPYPARHTGGVVIDEMNLTKWLMEYKFTGEERHAARLAAQPGSPQERLLDAAERVIQDAERAARGERYPAPLHGKALFDEVDRQCQGQLAALVESLAGAGQSNPRLALTPEVLRDPENQPSNVLEHLVGALYAELAKWQRGDTWNSCVRIAYTQPNGGHRKVWVLGITERRQLREEVAPGRVLLDATADAAVLRRLFSTEVRVLDEAVEPPPTTQHIHLPRRYAKSSMSARHGRDQGRAIAQARYLLGELRRAGGTQRVGLITYKECVQAMGDALGIPDAQRGWFWAERGSNAKQDCDTLFVVGTPTLPPDEVARLGRALYYDDAVPILDGTEAEGESGLHNYRDPRLQELSTYLTNAELTQCAHRNRPLWHDGRVVVTFSLGEVAYLPVTTRIDALPELDKDGTRADVRRQVEREDELERAYQAILARQERPTVAALRREAGVGTITAQAWLKQRRVEAAAPCDATESRSA